MINLEFNGSLQLQIIGSEDYEVGAAIKAALLYASDMESEAKQCLCENCDREMLLYDKLKSAIDARKERAQKVSEARRKAIGNRWSKRNINQ